MPRTRPSLALLLTVAILEAGATSVAAESRPPARRDDTVITVGESRVPDPYRWLENQDDPEVKAWAEAEDAYARRWIAEAGLDREALRRTLQEAASTDRFLTPREAAGRYFYIAFSGAVTRLSLRVRDGLDGDETTILDADALEADGLRLALRFRPSPDGRRVAVILHPPESRRGVLRVVNVETGRLLDDQIPGVDRGSSFFDFTADGSSLYYEAFESAADEPLAGERLRLHRLGQPVERDRTLLDRDGGVGRLLGTTLTDDRSLLVVTESDEDSTGNRLLVVDPNQDPPRVTTLVDSPDASWNPAGKVGDELWLWTDRDAPRGRVVALSLKGLPELREVVGESEATIDTWTGARVAGSRLLIGYREDGRFRIRTFDLKGRPSFDVELPWAGSVWSGFQGRRDSEELFYSLSGFVDPGTVYRLDLRTGVSTVFLEPEMPFDPREFVTRQVHYEGPEGRPTSMFLAYDRATPPDGQRPVMMYGYGFNAWASSPWFRTLLTAWLARGGAFALPALRGGGEYGDTWHQAGIRQHRGNAVEDYLAAARWLVAEGLARPGGLVAESTSAGGHLVASAVLAEPELFGAVVLGFPLLDLLRYDRSLIGPSLQPQLGDPNSPEAFGWLTKLSPIHQMGTDRCLPPTLVAPGEKDELTPAWHAYKFTAAARRAQICDDPILLRVAWGAGHAYGADAARTVDALTDILSFLDRSLAGRSPGSAEGPEVTNAEPSRRGG